MRVRRQWIEHPIDQHPPYTGRAVVEDQARAQQQALLQQCGTGVLVAALAGGLQARFDGERQQHLLCLAACSTTPINAPSAMTLWSQTGASSSGQATSAFVVRDQQPHCLLLVLNFQEHQSCELFRFSAADSLLHPVHQLHNVVSVLPAHIFHVWSHTARKEPTHFSDPRHLALEKCMARISHQDLVVLTSDHALQGWRGSMFIDTISVQQVDPLVPLPTILAIRARESLKELTLCLLDGTELVVIINFSSSHEYVNVCLENLAEHFSAAQIVDLQHQYALRLEGNPDLGLWLSFVATLEDLMQLRKQSPAEQDDWEFLQRAGDTLKLGFSAHCSAPPATYVKQLAPSVSTTMTAATVSTLDPALVLWALHLLHEDCQLVMSGRDLLDTLSPFLQQLATYLQLPHYVSYYRDRVNPLTIQSPNSLRDNEMSGSAIPDHPPQILTWLTLQLQSPSSISAFPVCKLACRTTQLVCSLFTKIADCVSHGLSGPERANLLMKTLTDSPIELSFVKRLVYGVQLPLLTVLQCCRQHLSHTQHAALGKLLDRDDLVANLGLDIPIANASIDTFIDDLRAEVCASETNANKQPSYPLMNRSASQDGTYLPPSIAGRRFCEDTRLREAQRILQSSTSIKLHLVQQPAVSDHEFLGELQAKLLALAQRTLSLSVGRGMLTLATMKPSPTEPLPIPPLTLSGISAGPPSQTLQLDNRVVDAQMAWPHFHNGAAAGLRLSREDAEGLSSTWILYNRPKGKDADATHAGFLYALGLSGHLKSLAEMNVYDYLSKANEITSIGVLLGLATAYRGTMDSVVAKSLSIHLPASLPGNPELEVQVMVQTAALLGFGFLYQATAHRRTTEILLHEIGAPALVSSGLSKSGLEVYSLSAGLALGLCLLGAGDSEQAPHNLDLVAKLRVYIEAGDLTGSQARRKQATARPVSDVLFPDLYEEELLQSWYTSRHSGVPGMATSAERVLNKHRPILHTDITAPGATLALGMMYLKTNNAAVAMNLKIPETTFLLDFVRPDILLLRTLGRSLIMWDDIQPNSNWVDAGVPTVVQHYFTAQQSTDRLVMQELLDTQVDLQTQRFVWYNIITGRCFAVALKYAGSADAAASRCVGSYVAMFRKQLAQAQSQRKGDVWTIQRCLVCLVTLWAVIMAGTGDLQVLRVIRTQRRQTQGDGMYGVHMALHMAAGFLFLGGGMISLGTNNGAVGALICALYPHYPASMDDNQYHLQALRHVYTLACEHRVTSMRDVHTGEECLLPMHITLTNGTTLDLTSPAMIPEHATVASISVRSRHHYPVTVLPYATVSSIGKGPRFPSIIYLQRRPSLIGTVLTAKTDLIAWARLFCADHQISNNPSRAGASTRTNIAELESLRRAPGIARITESNESRFHASLLKECVTLHKEQAIGLHMFLRHLAISLKNKRRTPTLYADLASLKLMIVFVDALESDLVPSDTEPLVRRDLLQALLLIVENSKL